ncbi:helix-turn-helix domain-containing protein [Enterococcus cecorum]|uniref:helix-turn-helix domain-containing protein n=1 Tax=Enterococcus cecorum TaxID=44008 RepID=UPI003F912E0F
MNRIKELRKNKGVTVKELSEIIGISQSMLSNYENGNSKPRNQDTWDKLSDYFNVSKAYIMGLSDYKTSVASSAQTLKKFVEKGVSYPKANSLIAEFLGEKMIFEFQEIMNLDSQDPEYTDKYFMIMEALEALYGADDESKLLIYFCFLDNKQKNAVLELLDSIVANYQP